MADHTPTPQELRAALDRHDLPHMFREELGWDGPQGGPVSVEVRGQQYAFTRIARKALFSVLLYTSPDDHLPSTALIRSLEGKLDQSVAERLVIYQNRAGTRAVWVRFATEGDGPKRLYNAEYTARRRNDVLVDYLQGLYVSLKDDLKGLTTIDVAKKASTLEVEKLTKRFYRAFDGVRKAFIMQISGVEGADRDHYAGLTLNRLMFVYFIQKKGYLDNDTGYLQNRLERVQARRGSGQFQSFYREFLLRLFHEGLGATPHDKGLTELIGQVPYLNGGLFEQHRIEADNPAIEIPDAAFKAVFDFFEGWRWTIDDRAKTDAKVDGDTRPEINPDVLGYIFEQYINNKQMGAYYTKEDITEYISKNTILPFILERAREGCRVAFEGENASVWNLLRDNPDRYIHAAVRYGAEHELPDEIKAGLDPEQPDLLEKRKPWNKRADETHALPTEIWREVVARHARYREVRGKLERGEVREIADLITLNLDIIQFTQDVIRLAEGPELVKAVWEVLVGNGRDKLPLSVLDPTCGSGAFLFAAANILEPLYHLCLGRMQEFVAALPADAHHERLRNFKDALQDMQQHNAQYYVLKQIIVRNLYGVDIMAEAVEIAKLRMFLKLMAFSQRDDKKPNMGLEPLPDIDFNIRAGNTLVGYATRKEAEDAVRGKALSTSNVTWEEIEKRAINIDQLETLFRKRQLENSDQVDTLDKRDLIDRMDHLERLLNSFLSASYGISEEKDIKRFDDWLISHQPFHWFIEFYSVMNSGGFDCVIGNPPYVEYKEVSNTYKVIDSKLLATGNLYSLISERAIKINKVGGYNGMIVPVSAFSTDRMSPFIEIFYKYSNNFWLSNFSWRPGKLFDGVNIQLSIWISKNVVKSGEEPYSTAYTLWDSEAREFVFDNLTYAKAHPLRNRGFIAKIGDGNAHSVATKISASGASIDMYIAKNTGTDMYYRRGGLYWKIFTDEPTHSSEEKILNVKNSFGIYAMIALLSSNLWFWYYTSTSDCRHLGNRDINTFPFNQAKMPKDDFAELSRLGKLLADDMKNKSDRRIRVYKGVNEVPVISFNMKKSKSIIDQIDVILGKYYKFTANELDYIINHNVKFRMRDDEVI